MTKEVGIYRDVLAFVVRMLLEESLVLLHHYYGNF